MKLDILITTAGGWPYPEKCIESILGRVPGGLLYPQGRAIPEGVRLLVRDNPSSKKDETYEYLVKCARDFGPDKFMLFSPDWAGEHGHNLDFLLTKTTAEWAIAIDSDLEFVSPQWLSALQELIAEYPAMQVAAEMSAHNSDPNDMALLPHQGQVPRIWTPRATSWFMLFKPSFMREQGVSFGRNDYEVQPRFRDVFPYPPPHFLRDSSVQRWTFENGWQLLWAGLFLNGLKEFSLVQIPPRVRSTYEHHNHKICPFMLNAGEKPNAPTCRAHWGQDIPQFIP